MRQIEEKGSIESERLRAKVVVVIPALNEQGGIGYVLTKVAEALRGRDSEVLVVDGRSRDRTVDIALSNRARVITQKGVGYGDALQFGFRYAYGRMGATILAMMDADGSYGGEDLPHLLGPIDAGEADVVIGNRFAGLEKGAMNTANRAGNRILSLCAGWALGTMISDTQSGMRAFRADIWRLLDTKTAGMPFAIEMIAEAREAGCKIAEVPISYHPRVGASKLRPAQDAISILITILRLTRDYKPLAFFGGLGMLFIALGTAEGITVVLEWLGSGTVLRIPSVVLSSTLLVTGALVLVLGLVADMIRDVKRFLRKSPPELD